MDLQGLLACGEARSEEVVSLFSDFQSVGNSRDPIFMAQQAEIDGVKREQSPEIGLMAMPSLEVRSNND